MRQLFLIYLLMRILFCQEESNDTVTIPSNSSSDEEIFIPLTSTFDDSEDILVESERLNEQVVSMSTTSDIPYLPLIQRCSTTSDCSGDKWCNDGKCLIPSENKFDFLPAMFHRCQSRLECASGSRCILNRCIPFHW